MSANTVTQDDRCGRCGLDALDGCAEVCWYCHGLLCPQCWDAYGHCGHPEADAENERARRVVQPS